MRCEFPITIWAWLLLSLAAVSAQEPQRPLTTGSLSELLGTDIPEPPPDPETLVQNGGFKSIPLTYLPPDVELRDNLVYAKYGDLELKLDLYLPPAKNDDLRPALIMVHGGAWRVGNKLDYRYHAGQFASRNYVTVSINYRLAPRHQWPCCLEDCKAAVRWLRSMADELRVDPSRIAMFGGSAGGHLSLMSGYCRDPRFEGDGGNAGIDSRIAAVVSLYGVTNLADEEANKVPIVAGMFSNFLGGPLHRIPETYAIASPVNHIRRGCPPTLIIHGTDDSMVPIAQAELLEGKLRDAGIPYVLDRVPGWPHLMDFSQPVNDRVVWLTERFLARAMPGKSETKP